MNQQQEDFDISEYSRPSSDEFSYMDVANEELTVTISEVKKSGDPKRGISIYLEGFDGRPWKPGKNMTRVIQAVWGRHASQLVGHRLRLFGDPNVTYGKEKPGGVRISHMDGITEPKTIPVRFKRGKSEAYVVRPLSELETVTLEQIRNASTVDELRALWRADLPKDLQAAIQARVKELSDDSGGRL